MFVSHQRFVFKFTHLNWNRNWVIFENCARVQNCIIFKFLIATEAQKQMCTYMMRYMLCIICIYIYVADIAAADSEVYMMRRSATIVLHDWIAQNSRAMHELNKPTKAHIFCWLLLLLLLMCALCCAVCYGAVRCCPACVCTVRVVVVVEACEHLLYIYSAYICVHIYMATTKKHTYT